VQLAKVTSLQSPINVYNSKSNGAICFLSTPLIYYLALWRQTTVVSISTLLAAFWNGQFWTLLSLTLHISDHVWCCTLHIPHFNLSCLSAAREQTRISGRWPRAQGRPSSRSAEPPEQITNATQILEHFRFPLIKEDVILHVLAFSVTTL
jgi:hypothetical protein